MQFVKILPNLIEVIRSIRFSYLHRVNDVLSSRILKPTSERLRPSHREEFVDTIHLYERSDGTYYKGGKWSFVSGHAANHMGVSIFMGAVLCGGFVLGGWMWGP